MTKMELQEEKLQEQNEKNEIREKLQMIEDMQAQMLAMQEKVQEANEFEQRISKLADDGKIRFKNDGELDIVVDRAE